MALNIRATTFTTPTSTGTQDVTIAGFGTPSACIIIGGDPVNTGDAIFSWGAYDGTNQACRYGYSEDATVGVDYAGHGYSDTTIIEAWVRAAGDNRRAYASVSFITDGVQLSWTVADSQGRADYILILFSGTGAAVGTFVGGGTVDSEVLVTGLSIKPRLMFTSGGNDDQPDTQSCQVNMGIAYATPGTYPQYFSSYNKESAKTPSVTLQATQSTKGIFSNLNNQWFTDKYIEITNMAQGQFGHTARVDSMSAFRIVYLALDVVNVDLEHSTFVTPADASSDWDPYTGTFQPNAVFMLGASDSNNPSQHQFDGGFNFGFFERVNGDSYGYNLTADDNVSSGTVGSNSHVQAEWRVLAWTVENVKMAAPNFDASGVVFPSAQITTSVNRSGFILAIGAEGTADYDFTGPVDGDDRVYNDQTSVNLPGNWPAVQGNVYLNAVGAGKDGNEETQIITSWTTENIVITVVQGDLQAGDKDIIVETI